MQAAPKSASTVPLNRAEKESAASVQAAARDDSVAEETASDAGEGKPRRTRRTRGRRGGRGSRRGSSAAADPEEGGTADDGVAEEAAGDEGDGSEASPSRRRRRGRRRGGRRSRAADPADDTEELLDDVEEPVEDDDSRGSRRRGRGRRSGGRGSSSDTASDRSQSQGASAETKIRRRILVNATEEEEIRIAVLDNDRLEDLHYERPAEKKYLGNVYKGRVVNLEPAIQAAFVDIGLNQAAFIYVDDVHSNGLKEWVEIFNIDTG